MTLPTATYRSLIADFLAAHSFNHEHGGYPAFEGELIADGQAIRADRKLNVFVTAVLCGWPKAPDRKPVPSLWFLVDRDAAGGTCDSFAVETELVIEALENADPAGVDAFVPLPAVEAREPHDNTVLAGDLSLYLRVIPTRIEPGSESGEPRLPADGIRFDVGEMTGSGESPPAYSFAMAGVTPLLALSATLDYGSGSEANTFAQELDELRREIEES